MAISRTYRAKPGDKFQLVAVEWVDSATRPGWKDWQSVLADHGPATCRSMGVLLENSSKHILLAGTWDRETGGVLEVIAIPKGCVISMEEIKWPRMSKTPRSKKHKK